MKLCQFQKSVYFLCTDSTIR